MDRDLEQKGAFLSGVNNGGADFDDVIASLLESSREGSSANGSPQDSASLQMSYLLPVEVAPCYSPTLSESSSKEASNNEAEREIDEGFDEEFELCDGEDLPLSRDLEPSAAPSLDMQDLQHLLVGGAMDSDAIPSSVLLDDLGVDLFDSESSSAHNLFDFEPVKSPIVAHVPSSPYQLPVGSPSVPTADIETLTLNDYNEFRAGGHKPSVSLSEYSEYGSLGTSSGGGSQLQYDELDDLCSHMCSVEPSLASLGGLQAAATYTSPSNSCLSVPVSNSARITLEATLHIDLPSPMTETKILFADHHQPQPMSHSNMASRTSPSPVPVSSPLIGRTSGNFGVQSYGLTGESMDTGGFAMKAEEKSSCCSQGSQTFKSSSIPAAPQTHSGSPTFTNGHSDSEPALKETNPTSSQKKLIEMPFYEFKKIIESPAVPEHDKVEVKNIRRRGKNKVAARHCRQRKLDVIFGLQKEIEQLKAAKSKFAVRSQKLQLEIEALRRRCTLAKKSTVS